MYSRHASNGLGAQLDEQHSYVKGGVGGRWLGEARRGEAIGQPYETPNEMARRSHRSVCKARVATPRVLYGHPRNESARGCVRCSWVRS